MPNRPNHARAAVASPRVRPAPTAWPHGVPADNAPTGARLVRALRRAARRAEADGRELADLASYLGGSGRRTLRRRAASCAADAEVLRDLTRGLARAVAHRNGAATRTTIAGGAPRGHIPSGSGVGV